MFYYYCCCYGHHHHYHEHYYWLKVIKREIRRQVRLPAGVDVERMEHRMTFDGHLLMLLLLGDADDDNCQYRVTTLSATTLYDRSSYGDDSCDDDHDDGEDTVAEQQLPDDDSQ